MKTALTLAFVAFSGLLAACHPVIVGGGTGGTGGEGASGGTGGTGGTGATGGFGGEGGCGGGHPMPCDGLSCGDPCNQNACDPSQGPCSDEYLPGFCDAGGTCVAEQPHLHARVHRRQRLRLRDRHAVPICADGSTACVQGSCVDGQCVLEMPVCPPPPPPPPVACTADADCPTPASCFLCPDGTTVACARGVCEDGTCGVLPGTCAVP